MSMCALVALVALLAATPAESAAVTPVQKVIQLLTGMVEKGKKEKHDEQVQFAAYKQFCDDTTVEKQRSIAEANEVIDKLKADIQKYEDEAAKLAREIAVHDDDIATWQGDTKASTNVRAIENKDYLASHQNYDESIQALRDGIKTLQGQNKVTKQGAAALAQVSAMPAIAPEQRKAIDSFLQQGQPEAAAYEFHSQGLVDMLEKLIEKFSDEQTELEKEETLAIQAYELLIQDMKTYIETATRARIDKAARKGAAQGAAGDAKSDLTETTTTRDADAKYLQDLTATCEQKSGAFEERQALRSGEIEAIEKAIEILSSGAVSGAADKHLPALLQTKKHSFAQLRTAETNPSQVQVAAYLSDQAERINSRILRALSVRVSEDPFTKVSKMIRDLITKLMEEANGEAEQKGWCDTELATNEQTRKAKTEMVETLHADIDELEASIAKLTEEIAELEQAVADSDAAVAKATAMRQDEKEKNTVAIADAKAAQIAVASALATLKDFYAKAAGATSLVQRAPEIFDEPYKGMQSESGGVVGMIEVIQSDFARLESETTAAEEEGQSEFEQFTNDSAEDKAQKQADIDSKTAKKAGDGRTLEEKRSDLTGTQKELDAALQYYDKLKPSCIDSGVSYDDRVGRRKEEIESLQQALEILDGNAV